VVSVVEVVVVAVVVVVVMNVVVYPILGICGAGDLRRLGNTR